MSLKLYYVRLRFLDGNEGMTRIKSQNSANAFKTAIKECQKDYQRDDISSISIIGIPWPVNKRERSALQTKVKKEHYSRYAIKYSDIKLEDIDQKTIKFYLSEIARKQADKN